MKKRLVHGGDWQGFRDQYGSDPLDFSANVSPLGVPQAVKEAIIKAVDHIDLYPDPLCRRLRNAIGEAKGIDPEYILCGNGGADLIFRTVQAVKPARALITAPAFAEYEEALAAGGCQVERYTLSAEKGFHIDRGFLEAVDGVDMVFLCEPNNPTGATTEGGLLLEIMEVCREKGVILFLDESFCEFLEDAETRTMLNRLEEFPNLIVLRAFTKIYAMAGVRLGCIFSSNKILLKRVRLCGQPWAVSHLAQEAGIAALTDEEYPEKVRELTRRERDLVRQGLEAAGLTVMPGEANYLLFHGAGDLADRLEEKGILIRRCDNYHGLGAGWFRTAIRTHEDNQQLIAAIMEVCHE